MKEQNSKKTARSTACLGEEKRKQKQKRTTNEAADCLQGERIALDIGRSGLARCNGCDCLSTGHSRTPWCRSGAGGRGQRGGRCSAPVRSAAGRPLRGAGARGARASAAALPGHPFRTGGTAGAAGGGGNAESRLHLCGASETLVSPAAERGAERRGRERRCELGEPHDPAPQPVPHRICLCFGRDGTAGLHSPVADEAREHDERETATAGTNPNERCTVVLCETLLFLRKGWARRYHPTWWWSLRRRWRP